MNIFIIAGTAMATVITALIVRKNTPEIALMLSISGAVIIALFALEVFSGLADEAEAVLNSVNADYFTVPLKTLGISVITSLTSRLCEDSGDKAMSFTVSFAGKTAILLSAMPLFSQLLEILSEVLKP